MVYTLLKSKQKFIDYMLVNGEQLKLRQSMDLEELHRLLSKNNTYDLYGQGFKLSLNDDKSCDIHIDLNSLGLDEVEFLDSTYTIEELLSDEKLDSIKKRFNVKETDKGYTATQEFEDYFSIKLTSEYKSGSNLVLDMHYKNLGEKSVSIDNPEKASNIDKTQLTSLEINNGIILDIQELNKEKDLNKVIKELYKFASNEIIYINDSDYAIYDGIEAMLEDIESYENNTYDKIILINKTEEFAFEIFEYEYEEEMYRDISFIADLRPHNGIGIQNVKVKICNEAISNSNNIKFNSQLGREEYSLLIDTQSTKVYRKNVENDEVIIELDMGAYSLHRVTVKRKL